MGPQDEAQKACFFHCRNEDRKYFITETSYLANRKGYDPVSLNCFSRLDGLGFSGFPGTLTQTQEEDICQSWACGAVCITELPATQQKK